MQTCDNAWLGLRKSRTLGSLDKQKGSKRTKTKMPRAGFQRGWEKSVSWFI